MNKLELKISNDGSHTLYRPDIDETYHSIHGAIQEAEHVFIQTGLAPLVKKKGMLTLLEMGLGTGLNALLTANYSYLVKQQIHYIGLEAFPVAKALIEKLNYVGLIGGTSQKHFNAIHDSQWGGIGVVNNYMTLQKVEQKLEDFTPHKTIDLVYYDAFGPNSQAEVWDIQLFKKLCHYMHHGGVLVTYCAKGQVRRDLQTAGFIVERLPGPPGKREMLRAIKP
ncbi:MAG: tRNA (5-methylaminomethyl-2-thiouridine)(34)-methyltransferase MnmD [Flavobacteriales bacterium]|jgi:tRNA U34 5-methylaminomethyl-2-thiouridine-forming methyltransferase MnmC|nr:tRNA (5-methylaminomethyl-2-thiouridine)(34)-methyltransferase MnmD [Flavobacteriales bacterium]